MGKRVKNILVGAAVLATAGVGLVGCTNVDLKQEQIDSVVTEAETFLQNQNSVDYDTLVTNLNNYLETNNKTLTEEQVREIVEAYLESKESTIEYVYNDDECWEIVKSKINKVAENYDQNNFIMTQKLTMKDSFGNIVTSGTYTLVKSYDSENKILKLFGSSVANEQNAEMCMYKEIKETETTYEITSYFVADGVYNKRIIPKAEFDLNEAFNFYGADEYTSILKNDGVTYYKVSELYTGIYGYATLPSKKAFLEWLNDMVDANSEYDVYLEIDSVSTKANITCINSEGEAEGTTVFEFNNSNKEVGIIQKMYEYGPHKGEYIQDSVMTFGNQTIDFDKTGYISIEEDQANKNA